MQATSAIATAACPAAGRHARHRATVRWHGGGIAMRRTGVIVALSALLSMLGGAMTASPALAGTGTRQLHLAVANLDFTSVTCVDPPGVDPSDPSCKMIRSTIVAEPGAFSFDNGTIYTHSHHEDCAVHGLRIDTTFEVTGGTGDFEGATGGGHEFSAAAGPVPVIFNGTITF